MKALNVKKLIKRLEKEYGIPDGYVRIDKVSTNYSADGSIITIKGAYGYPKADGNYYQKEFSLMLDGADGTNYEYIAGMFTQYIFERDN